MHLGTDCLIITNIKEVISYPTVHVNACQSENKQNILKWSHAVNNIVNVQTKRLDQEISYNVFSIR